MPMRLPDLPRPFVVELYRDGSLEPAVTDLGGDATWSEFGELAWAGLDHWHGMHAYDVRELDNGVVEALLQGDDYDRIRFRPVVESDATWLTIDRPAGRTLAAAAAAQWALFRPLIAG